MTDYPFKTNEFIEEDTTVRKMVPKVEGNKISFEAKDIPVKQKVMYIDAPKQKAICKRGEHNWIMTDPRKYLFACTKCSYHYKAFPISFEYDGHSLINKRTGEKI